LRLQHIGRDPGRGGRRVELRLADRAAADQGLGARQVGLCLGQLRVQRRDLRIDRALLEYQLFIADRRQDLPTFDVVALLDRKGDDRTAGAHPRRHDLDAFDRGKHGFLIGCDNRLDGKG
jgi:hypothetical protein